MAHATDGYQFEIRRGQQSVTTQSLPAQATRGQIGTAPRSHDGAKRLFKASLSALVTLLVVRFLIDVAIGGLQGNQAMQPSTAGSVRSVVNWLFVVLGAPCLVEAIVTGIMTLANRRSSENDC